MLGKQLVTSYFTRLCGCSCSSTISSFALMAAAGRWIPTNTCGKLIRIGLGNQLCQELPYDSRYKMFVLITNTTSQLGTSAAIPLGTPHTISSQIIWIPFGCRCAPPTSHLINFCCVGQAEACLTESTLDTSAHGGQNAGPIHWIGLPLDVVILVPIPTF